MRKDPGQQKTDIGMTITGGVIEIDMSTMTHPNTIADSLIITKGDSPNPKIMEKIEGSIINGEWTIINSYSIINGEWTIIGSYATTRIDA